MRRPGRRPAAGRPPPAPAPEEARVMLVAGEDRGRRAQLGAHVRDGRPLGHGQRADTRATTYRYAAHAALHGQPPQHLQDHVLGGDPRPRTTRSARTARLRGMAGRTAPRPSPPPHPARRRRWPASQPARRWACGCRNRAAFCPARRSAPGAPGGRCRCRRAEDDAVFCRDVCRKRWSSAFSKPVWSMLWST